jgi:release factor glutamine methyltransferase
MLAHALSGEVTEGSDVLDMCTGSGLLAVTAAMRGARATAVDVSRRALLSARLNARMNGTRVRTRRGWLFEAVPGERFDTIVSNPPYLPAATDALPANGPERAWEAGRDGRALLDPICEQVGSFLRPGGSVLLVHSSVCGIERTLALLSASGLQAGVVDRSRGPLGPRLLERASQLWAAGVLAPGDLHEDVVVIRGKLPAAVPATAPVTARA